VTTIDDEGVVGAGLLFAAFVLVSVLVPAEDSSYGYLLEVARYGLFALLAILLISKVALRDFARFAMSSGMAMLAVMMISYWCLSVVWSDDWLYGAQKATLLLLSVGAISAVVMHYGVKRVVSTLTIIMVAFVLLGAIVALLDPSIGVEDSFDHAGKWKGIAGQKNRFGQSAAIAAVLLLSPRECLPRSLAKRTWIRLLLIIACVLCLLMSQSRGAASNFVTGAMVLLLFKLPRRWRKVLVVGTIAALPALLLVTLTQVSIIGTSVSAFGYEFDTSNRLLIWSYAFSDWYTHEMLGVGYGGFWTDARTVGFESAYGWVLPNFHNGYVSLLIETGIVGGVMFTLLIVRLLGHIFLSGDVVRRQLSSMAALVVMFLVNNIYENNLTRSTDIFMLIFFAAIAVFSLPALSHSKGIRLRRVGSAGGRFGATRSPQSEIHLGGERIHVPKMYAGSESD
jgi:O-antigen ligase